MPKPPTGETLPGEISPPETLADLREEIDRIDASLHGLLMERGEIIDRLIKVKARQGGGSAFRPSREADMMRRLVERHQGLLPVDTVETIWRIIISTFTYVQSNYAVHADVSCGDALMRDSCRFHFGFTVPLKTHESVHSVVEAIKASKGDLGLVRIAAGAIVGPWWKALTDPQAPKIIARLPFVERPDHPAGLPLFVVATPLAEATARDVVILSVTLDQWHGDLVAYLADHGIEILDKYLEGEPSLLLAFSRPESAAAENNAIENQVITLFQGCGVKARAVEIGSHAARFDLARRACSAEPTL